MFLINCPYCGERDQQEFKAGGEAHIERPKQPTELSDDEWAEYLFTVSYTHLTLPTIDRV